MFFQAIFDSNDLTSVITDVAVIMSNRAAALMMNEDAGVVPKEALQQAMIDSCISSLWNRNKWKPWIRQTGIIERSLGIKDALRHAQRIFTCVEEFHEKNPGFSASS